MLRVLIVEDEEIIRKGFVHTINWLEMGCQVVGEACNGEEGLGKIREYKPDLVITDIIMPKMDGIEMLVQAQAIHDFKSIILTSYSEFGYAKKAIELQVFDYILKPVDEEKLMEIIERVKKEVEEKHTYNEILEKSKNKKSIELIDMDIYITPSKNYSYYIAESVKAIKENYHTKISIELLAEHFNVSISYLSRKFKEETNQTFLEVLHKYRIQKSMELLREGSYRIGEVASRVGFNEYKSFCHVFKKYMGIAPTEFMKGRSVIMASKTGDKV